ncbi:hypothetical protein [Nocardia sp. NPDC060259]|uniref:hypothetical protein n=1 Tax=Nocardia sp. NPDC060259 TaxID=3347088 RepID=UPI003661101A
MAELWHVITAVIAGIATYLVVTVAVLLFDSDVLTHPVVVFGTVAWAVAAGVGVFLWMRGRKRLEGRAVTDVVEAGALPSGATSADWRPRLARRHRNLVWSIRLDVALLIAVLIGYGIAFTQGYTPGRGDAALPFLLLLYLGWAIHDLRTVNRLDGSLGQQRPGTT